MDAPMMTPARRHDEITDPLAKRVNDWLSVMNRSGWAAVITGLVVLFAVCFGFYIGPEIKTYYQEQIAESRASRTVMASMLAEQARLREEYSAHELEHVKATANVSSKLDRANELQSQTLEAIKSNPAFRDSSIWDHDRRGMGGEKTSTQKVGGEGIPGLIGR